MTSPDLQFLEAWIPKPDPPKRADGCCAVCEKPMRKITRQVRRYAGYQIDEDPFCSTGCCREYHGNPLGAFGSGFHQTPKMPAVCGSTGAYKSGCRCETCKQAEAARGREKRARHREAVAA